MRRPAPLLRPRRALALAAPWLLLAGCYSGAPSASAAGDDDPATASGSGADDGDGDGGTAGSEGGEMSSCGEGPPSAAARPLRRLTPVQYRNSLTALLELSDLVVTYDAQAAVIGLREVRQLRDDAEAAVARIDAWPASLLPCDVHGTEDPTCPQAFIDAVGPLAFRRPLLPAESQWLRSIYDDARATMAFSDAMEVLAETLLQAPAVVYMEEHGAPGPDDIAPVVRVSDFELANRISFFLWDGPPDDALRTAAATAQLHTESELRAQVARMMDDPRAQAHLTTSIWHALQLDGGTLHFSLFDADKRPDLYPDYGLGLQYSMQVELEAFVQSVLAGTGTFDELLTSRRAYVDDALAALYGVPAPSAVGETWHWVDLPDTQRAGILTRAAFLTVFANTATQSPIRRGTITLRELLCVALGDPPPNVDDSPLEGGPHDGGNWSVRQAVEARTAEPECSSCHSIINPVGFAFEHYDAIGAWQDTEALSGLPIDASGSLAVSDAAGPLQDALDLSARIAGSQDARACFAERWLSEALGGALGALDECTRDQIVTQFAQTGDLRALVTAIVLSDSFRHLNLGPLEDGT